MVDKQVLRWSVDGSVLPHDDPAVIPGGVAWAPNTEQQGRIAELASRRTDAATNGYDLAKFNAMVCTGLKPGDTVGDEYLRMTWTYRGNGLIRCQSVRDDGGVESADWDDDDMRIRMLKNMALDATINEVDRPDVGCYPSP